MTPFVSSFLIRGREFEKPRVGGGSSSQTIKTIGEFYGVLPPMELFKRLSIDRYINLNTWLELQAGVGAVRINLPKQILPPFPEGVDGSVKDAMRLSQARADEDYFRKRLSIFILPKEFKQDLKSILGAYGNGGVSPGNDNNSSVALTVPSARESLNRILPKLVTFEGKALCEKLISSLGAK